MQKLSDEALLKIVATVRIEGSQRKAAKALGCAQSRVSENIAEAKRRGLVKEADGRVDAFEAIPHELPPKGEKWTYILTCAQDYTKLHMPVWKNLLALADETGAYLMVSTFKYDKDAMGQASHAKFDTREQELASLYPPEILPYVCDDRVDLAPNLTWCGELNVLPTADRPLSGLESYTHRNSTIVPHPKLELVSVPAMKGEGVKLMYTTGCVTQRNYIKRKVGYKAEHFHSYGALLVEVNHDGSWYCRQLQLGPDDAIYDLDKRVKDGKVTCGHRVQDICWGDVHAGRLDQDVAKLSWGRDKGSILETLRPYTQHVHDLLDFSGRSHHTRKDPHAVFRAHFNGEWVLTDELIKTASVLWDDITREWCETYAVNANHDRHLDVFLKEMDWRDDPVNARLILALNLKLLDAIVGGYDHDLVLMEHSLKLARHNVRDSLTKEQLKHNDHFVKFLKEDESHVILEDIDGGIEAGLHGDRGANGAKGTINGIGKLDRKVNGADKHQIAIRNHAYFCGTSGRLVQGWNHGLSSWTHAHTITYVNGTRTIVSLWKGAWRG